MVLKQKAQSRKVCKTLLLLKIAFANKVAHYLIVSAADFSANVLFIVSILNFWKMKMISLHNNDMEQPISEQIAIREQLHTLTCKCMHWPPGVNQAKTNGRIWIIKKRNISSNTSHQ